MPFIRYEIGDIGLRGEKWNYLKKIEGREMSVFKTEDGKVIPAEFFIHFIGVVYNKGYISKFQVIQEDYYLIKIKLVVINNEEFDKNKNIIEKSIKNVMGNECEVIWEIVADIENLPSGKYLYTVSKIK
jgi:phenylacetate-CoA ligase